MKTYDETNDLPPLREVIGQLSKTISGTSKSSNSTCNHVWVGIQGKAFDGFLFCNKCSIEKPKEVERSKTGLIEANYHELIMAVAKKFPNETRHETALRYIRQHEDNCNSPSLGISKITRKEHNP